MALGSVAISGGMSKKEKERLMYMDGKLVWSSSSLSDTIPDTVDYVIVKNVVPVDSTSSAQDIPTEIRIARGGTGLIGLYQRSGSSGSSAWYWSYATLTFSANGKLSISYPGYNYTISFHFEGYQYI